MDTRRAQGLSTSTLIMIALGIIILITSIVFYTQNVDNAEETIGNCQNLGGECMDNCNDPRLFENAFGVCSNNQVCCTGNS